MDTSLKTYLVRAVYEYCLHHGKDPYAIVAKGGISLLPIENLPEEKRTITFNLSNNAIREFCLEDGHMSFSSRFNGKIIFISVAIDEITWMGSPTNDIGLAFDAIMQTDSKQPSPPLKQEPPAIDNLKLRLL